MNISRNNLGLRLWIGLVLGLGCIGLSSGTVAHAQDATLAPVPAGARFANSINAFARQDQIAMPPTGAVLFVGSSTIRIWTTLAQDFPEIPVINRGFGGSDLSDSVNYAGRIVIPYQPKIIVLFAGSNDLALSHKKPARVLADFEAFAAEIHAALPNTRLVYLSISPTLARWDLEPEDLETNRLIQGWIAAHNSPTQKLNFLDTHSQFLGPDGRPQAALLRADGLHLNKAGYTKLVEIVKPQILAWAAADGVKLLGPQGQ